MSAKWMPQSGIDALISQIEHGVVFGYFTNNPFTDKQLLNAFMLQTAGAKCYGQWLKDWRARPADQQTYPEAKIFLYTAHIQWGQESRGANFGFGGNAQVYDADTDNIGNDN